MRSGNAAALVIPAHTLTGEARQFGAEPLSDIAEGIEAIARDCIERHDVPTEAIEHVVGRAEVREVFSAGKHGKAAGLLVVGACTSSGRVADYIPGTDIAVSGSVSNVIEALERVQAVLTS